jgi:hypothetical protein
VRESAKSLESCALRQGPLRLEVLPVIQAAAFESSRSRCVFDLKPFLLPKSRQLDYFRDADLNEAALRRTLSRAKCRTIFAHQTPNRSTPNRS